MSESKRCVVFAVDEANPNKDGLDECIEFYVFDEDFIPVKNEEGDWPIKIKDPSQIARPLSVLNHCHVLASYASLGCHVYCIGGLYFRCAKCENLSYLSPSTAVDCWDTINNCWTSLPPMNLGRHLLDLHVFKGELFAIGGYTSNDKFIFIEKLDESKGCWTPLAYPPPTVKLDCNEFVSVAIEHKGFILFGSRACKSFYAYTPPRTWKCMYHLPFDHDTLLYECLHSPAVVLDNHVFWLDGSFGSTLVGFDVDYGKYFKIDLASEGLLLRPECRHYFPKLVHVGNGVLALVWRDECLFVLEGEGKGKGKGKCKGKGKGKVEDGEQYDLEEAFRGFHCSRFSIDFVRARAK